MLNSHEQSAEQDPLGLKAAAGNHLKVIKIWDEEAKKEIFSATITSLLNFASASEASSDVLLFLSLGLEKTASQQLAKIMPAIHVALDKVEFLKERPLTTAHADSWSWFLCECLRHTPVESEQGKAVLSKIDSLADMEVFTWNSNQLIDIGNKQAMYGRETAAYAPVIAGIWKNLMLKGLGLGGGGRLPPGELRKYIGRYRFEKSPIGDAAREILKVSSVVLKPEQADQFTYK